jgi:hypothetical protein
LYSPAADGGDYGEVGAKINRQLRKKILKALSSRFEKYFFHESAFFFVRALTRSRAVRRLAAHRINCSATAAFRRRRTSSAEKYFD